MCCHDFSKGPLKNGCRKSILTCTVRFLGYIQLFLAGLFYTTVEKDADYSYYLGDDYESKYDKNVKKASTIVSNHITWLDSQTIFMALGNVAFGATSELENVPITGKLAKALDFIFIPRGGSVEERNKALEIIGERQAFVEQNPDAA